MKRAPTLITRPNLVFLAIANKGLRSPILKCNIILAGNHMALLQKQSLLHTSISVHHSAGQYAHHWFSSLCLIISPHLCWSSSLLLITTAHHCYSSFLLIYVDHHYYSLALLHCFSYLLLIIASHHYYSSLLLIIATHICCSSLLLITIAHLSCSSLLLIIDAHHYYSFYCRSSAESSLYTNKSFHCHTLLMYIIVYLIIQNYWTSNSSLLSLNIGHPSSCIIIIGYAYSSSNMHHHHLSVHRVFIININYTS